MRVGLSLIGLAIALALGLLGLAAGLWGLALGLIVSEEDGKPLYDLPSFIWLIAAGGTLAAAVGLWRTAHRLRWPDRDADGDLLGFIVVVWYTAIGIAVLWVVLRVTGVIGPIISERGL